MTHATGAEDVEAELPEERRLAEHVPSLPHLEEHDEVA
jgi:hypothetical protein